MRMKNLLVNLLMFAAVALVSTGCSKLGKSKSKGVPNDGQLHGISNGSRYVPFRPPGMVYVPQGTFHMGPSDEDVSYAFNARNKQISINGFWMDAVDNGTIPLRRYSYLCK